MVGESRGGICYADCGSVKSHVDATINDQYNSVTGARRFINNIVQYPGCGSFFPPASLVADRPDGGMAGVIFGSLVAADTGHITQVCVLPAHKGQGVGIRAGAPRTLCVHAKPL